MAWAQETLNADDPNTFIFGGDQKSSGASIELLPIAIIDIEPETLAGAGGGAGAGTEAGLPPPSGGVADLSDLWLNYTYRSENGQPAQIFVSTNQPIPGGMRIEVEIKEFGAGGDYSKTNKDIVKLSESEKVVVSDFPSGYTGDGLNRGYHITYKIKNAKTLPAGFEIVYRIQ
tara:strand:+ start:1647 stop:2165 length:519 start_codon:yes stop_codon:yes gene_type:complete